MNVFISMLWENAAKEKNLLFKRRKGGEIVCLCVCVCRRVVDIEQGQELILILIFFSHLLVYVTVFVMISNPNSV